ncbi:Uncharacterised protein [Yersinia massiliensis]|uniref:hypothetical protein n=1 Tax=Yersinia massiliensis TaxID=419257 RepID=UPI0005DE146D|nr:hypothetical protein [Yersinia massiliensis]CNI77011.1 Uncharacterised protein [Yersinia massiliensis]
MNNIEELVYNAMQSSLEGYAASVVDSIEFELKRELTTDEHQQVFVAVDRAITGIDAAQKEINNLKMKLADAGCLLVEWKKRVEKAEKKRDDLLNQEFQQRLANAEHQLYMKDLAIHNIKASRKAQFRKRLAAEAELSAANEKYGWIKRSDQMPDPNQQRRVCVFTPSSAADLRYRLVPANLFKAVCSSSTHWHYVNDPVEGNADEKEKN